MNVKSVLRLVGIMILTIIGSLSPAVGGGQARIMAADPNEGDKKCGFPSDGFDHTAPDPVEYCCDPCTPVPPAQSCQEGFQIKETCPWGTCVGTIEYADDGPYWNECGTNNPLNLEEQKCCIGTVVKFKRANLRHCLWVYFQGALIRQCKYEEPAVAFIPSTPVVKWKYTTNCPVEGPCE